MTKIFEPLAFEQKMKIVGDKLVIEISRKFWKALEGKEVDSKQRLSSHAACNAWQLGVDRQIRSRVVSETNIILFLRL